MTDQQPEATRNASCKLLQCSRKPPFFIPTVAMGGGGGEQKQLLRPDVVQVTGVSDTDADADESSGGDEALPALFLGGLLQRAL